MLCTWEAVCALCGPKIAATPLRSKWHTEIKHDSTLCTRIRTLIHNVICSFKFRVNCFNFHKTEFTFGKMQCCKYVNYDTSWRVQERVLRMGDFKFSLRRLFEESRLWNIIRGYYIFVSWLGRTIWCSKWNDGQKFNLKIYLLHICGCKN